jgi:hypothetical protein
MCVYVNICYSKNIYYISPKAHLLLSGTIIRGTPNTPKLDW